jgi:molybdopterin synthase sulfur carrier subunit
MYRYKVKAFGITKDILGHREMVVDLEGNTVNDLRRMLNDNYPGLRALKSLFIAINSKYAEEQQELNEHDEIALIPPVSGG